MNTDMSLLFFASFLNERAHVISLTIPKVSRLSFIGIENWELGIGH
jgi:hypothetical protein